MNKFSKLLLIVTLMCSASVLCSVYATNYYVGFSSNPAGVKYSGDVAGLKSALLAAGASDTVYIAKGTYYLDSQLIVKTHIIGGCYPTGDGRESQRTAIGAAGNLTSDMTVLDGNSLRHPRRVEKHRVATVNANGIIENCLIRNGHAWSNAPTATNDAGHGGGVLLNGGKLYNCIIRGNVAMNVAEQEDNPSSGGGVYITNNGGQVINCVIVFNMDDKGVGIDGVNGESINNTVAYNTQTPTWIDIEGGTFHPYGGSQQLLPTTKTRYIHLDPFYIASTECTSGQYACFMSAVDMGSYGGTYPPYLSSADRDSLVKAKAPVPAAYTGYDPSGITVSDYAMLDLGGTNYAGGSGTTIGGSIWNILQSNVTFNYAGLTASSTTDLSAVWYPVKGGTAAGTGEAQRRDNYAMSYVSWWGSLAFSLWIGGCLPTEAQWEYAARQKENGTTDDSYYYAGATANSNAGLNEVGWWSGNYGSIGVHEVAKKKKTGRGLYDMSGNLWEWCLDAYDNSFSTLSGVLDVFNNAGKDLVSSGSGNGSSVANAKMNPVAISDYSSGSRRVYRGGTWGNAAAYCSLGYRGGGYPDSCGSDIGFRAVCVP